MAKIKIPCVYIHGLIVEIAKRASQIANDGKSVLEMPWEELTVADILEWLDQYKEGYEYHIIKGGKG
jgi:hypothetical protein